MGNELEKIDPETGEVMTIEENHAAPLAVQLAQAELNQAVTTAKAFPRSITQAVKNIMSLATLDEESAKECVYALPRGGKPIKGPSVRFAEIVASQWGNCHTGSRVVDVDRFEKVVVAEGVFHDLETGLRRTAQIRRRISGRDGRIYNDDMIAVTGNAAASIAMREAILKGIPKAVWRKAYEHCEKAIVGDVKTLNQTRDETLKAFHAWGITPEQIYAALEIGGIDDIGLDQIGTLRAIYKAVKDGAQKLEDYFPAHSDQKKATEAAKGTAAKLGKIAEQGKEKAGDTEKGGKAANEKGAAEKGKDKGKSAESQGEEGGERGEGESDQPDAGGEADEQADDAGSVGNGDVGDDGEVADEQPDDDALEAAFARGEKAREQGRSRKAVPKDLTGNSHLVSAWERGWDGE